MAGMEINIFTGAEQRGPFNATGPITGYRLPKRRWKEEEWQEHFISVLALVWSSPSHFPSPLTMLSAPEERGHHGNAERSCVLNLKAWV